MVPPIVSFQASSSSRFLAVLNQPNPNGNESTLATDDECVSLRSAAGDGSLAGDRAAYQDTIKTCSKRVRLDACTVPQSVSIYPPGRRAAQCMLLPGRAYAV